MKRLKDNSDAPEARRGILTKTCASSKKKTRLHSTFPRRNGYSPLRQQTEREEREFVVDSGSSMHMVNKKDLKSAELETMRTSRSPTTVMTANGEVQTREEATVKVKQLDLFVKVLPPEETPQFFYSAKIVGIPTTGPLIKNHISPKNGKKINCNIANCVPFVVPGLSASSSSTALSLTSSSSSSQDSVFATKPHELPDWLQEFRENLVDERCPLEPRGNP